MKAAAYLALLSLIVPTQSVRASPAAGKEWERSSRIRDLIRDQIANYALLIDGDGERADARRWADELWTRDATFQVFDDVGQPMFGGDGLRGRDAIFAAFAPADGELGRIRTRHLFLNVRFDRVEHDKVDIHMVGYIVHARSDHGDARAGDDQLQPNVYVYKERWLRCTDGKWRIAKLTAYCSINCIQSAR